MAKKTQRRNTKKKAGRQSTISFPCIKFTQANYEMYLFVADAKELWGIVEVNELDPDKESGYQRAASPSRVARIAKFIDAGKALPLSVLIAFNHGSYDASSRRLRVPNRSDAGWVIDGQHRLAGAHKAEESILIPVVAMVNLGPEAQVDFFVTINREQKGVPTSLYYELLKQLPGDKSEAEITKERAADVALKLRSNSDSPFHQRIVSVTKPKRGELSLTNVVRKLAPLLKRDGRLAQFSDEDRARIISNLYLALENVFPTEYKKSDSVFFRTVGFGAIMNALPILLDTCLNARGGFRVSDVAYIFNKIKPDLNFANWREIGSGNAAELAAAEDILAPLKEATETQTIEGNLKL